MRHFYLDTNVFISRWKPDDPYYSEAKIIASSLQKGEISAYTSALTLLETASVAGRLYAHRMKDKGPEQKKLFIIKTIRRLAVMRIRFIHLVGDIPLRLGNVKVDMPTLLADSIFLSFLTALRTLDLMHIAAARHAKQMNSEKLGAFITGDAELLARKDEISKIIGMPVLSPKEYVHALGLQ
jgi:predicted nucleic acid-binding protein